jgi:hypothetical protein
VTDLPLAYVPGNAEPTVPREELRARIPGWGADADPRDRPSYPRERFDPEATGAHWTFPDRQPETYPREKSLEHGILPPVFGTVAPLHGLSGAIRRYSYDRFSEGRAAHWLLLVLGDRVDAVESHLKSFASRRPDDPITETGVLAEPSHRPWTSRFGESRTDIRHAWMDPILVVGPWIVGAFVAGTVVRRLVLRR